MDEVEFYEPWGPEYVRPAAPDCPNCSCCTARLCERGAKNPLGCIGLTSAVDDDTRRRIVKCPCSDEETEGTASHEIKVIRDTVSDPEERKARVRELFERFDGFIRKSEGSR